uniref:Uncharacterized protein n=1 Tax=Rhizophora mucronata TaxID=61149 RepID=A0A2P2P1B4_RHIMU
MVQGSYEDYPTVTHSNKVERVCKCIRLSYCRVWGRIKWPQPLPLFLQ